ncbi:MAG TPA: serine/threonine-protein kinase [Streptosporangiaceae bacterium]|nr:serine/threonine-protein kinase [Streptosporangiaceae bacterium]
MRTDEDAATAGRLVSGRYRLLSPIGRGAMGIVWRGHDELLDREVAVKEVRAAGPGGGAAGPGGGGLRDSDATAPGGGTAGDSVYQRTLREAKAAARLTHPGVVTVFDVVEEDGGPWIVMELVPARSLDRAIAEDGPLRPHQAALVGAHLLSALACAHEAGVLHRDVKPGNVLLGPDDRTVLTDFGIATFAGDPALTQAGMVFGTPGFTAPERLRGEGATPASDLWSLGATLYTAVEGRGPFERPGGSAAIMAGVAGEPAPRAPSAGPLAPVIDALLQADPARRPDAATTARLLADAAADAEPGWAHRDLKVSHDAPAFGDVREFPCDLAYPADLPASVALPDLMGPPAPGELPAFTNPPRFLDAPGWPDGSGFPGAAASAGAAGRDATSRPGGHRARMAAITAVAVTVAALAGWFAYPRPHNTAASGSPPATAAPAAPAARPRPGDAASAARGTASTGTGHGSAAGAAAGAGASGSTGSASTGSGSTGSGPATGGAPTTTPPAGYQWYQVTAASAGTAAGFEIAIPATWQASAPGPDNYLRPPAGSAFIEVSLAPFSYARPLRQATFLQAQAIRADLYPGYRLIALTSQTLLGAPDAAWRFSWRGAGAGRVEVLELLVSIDTTAGTQPYALTVSAPAVTFPAALTIFRQVVATFEPLP